MTTLLPQYDVFVKKLLTPVTLNRFVSRLIDNQTFLQLMTKLTILLRTGFFVLLTICTTQLQARSQNYKVTITANGQTLQRVFKEIKKQTGLVVFYSDALLNDKEKITINVKQEPLTSVMDRIISDKSLRYEIQERYIVISARPPLTVDIQPTVPTENHPPPPIDIQGRVVNEKGEPLQGVSIIEKATKNITVTDAGGNFKLKVKGEKTVIIISYMGYKTEEVVVNKEENISIVLQAETNRLDDVVVVGYGAQKRLSLTSAIVQVKGEEITHRPVSNLQQALQGIASGVTILDEGGSPGKSSATIRIRGITSLGSNDPLVIVDGLEQRLIDINPNDVESISILKDASSTAIYGSRAANGVILITTKRGKEGKTAVLFNGFTAIQKVINKPQMMDVRSYMEEQNVAYVNAGLAEKYTQQEIDTYVNATDRLKYPLPYNWNNSLFKSALQTGGTLSISGGNENVKTHISLRYQDQGGVIPNIESKIREIRLNNDFKVSKNIKLSTDINYRYLNYLSPVSEFNVYNFILQGSLWAVPKYPDGSYGVSAQGNNPLMYAELGGTSQNQENFFVSNTKADWHIVKGLKFTTQIGVRDYKTSAKNYQNAYTITNYYNPAQILKSVPNNTLTEIRTNFTEYTFSSLLTYENIFGPHSVNVLTGYSQIGGKRNSISAYRQNFYNNSIQSLSQGANNSTMTNTGGDSKQGLRSYFGRIDYSYRDKYFFEANGRYDGSSNFSSSHQYAFFPSFSGGWRISQEDFWSSIKNVVNEFKIRGSWGKTGNQAIPPYQFYPALSLVNYTFGGTPAQGYISNILVNQDLTWETTRQVDVGLDVQMFDRKLTLTVDYYKKRTTGILLVLPVPATIGQNPSYQNAGIVENNGWDIQASYNNKNNALKYTLSANFNINNNKVVSLNQTGPYISGTTINPQYIIKEGYPINSHWGYLTDGLFQTQTQINNYPTLVAKTMPGDVKYLDFNNDGKINSADQTIIGNSFPVFTFGTSINLEYKSFQLNILLQGAADVSTRLDGSLMEMGINEGITSNILTNNYWTPSHTNARFPRPIKFDFRNVYTSDRILVDGSYLRVKNIQLVYTLPEALTQKIKINKASLYISTTNVFTISKLNEWGLDPEFPSGRGRYYPQTALTTFGVNIQF